MKSSMRFRLVAPSFIRIAAFALIAVPAAADQVVVTFDQLPLAPNSYNTGPMPGATETHQQMWGIDAIVYQGPFETQGAAFNNRLVLDAANGSQLLWNGFAYSNQNDRTTEGYTNQYSVYANGGGLNADGVADGGNFAVAFGYRDQPFNPQTVAQLAGLPTFTIPTGAIIEGLFVTNTTYAALSMLNGDGFAKAFGGDDGNDPDWFKLTAYGYADGLVKAVDFFLADYRFDDNSLDYILDTWEYMDLSALAGATQIFFNLSSSDVGAYGMNTPAYFAVDNISYRIDNPVIPEPASLVMAGIAAVGLFGLVARRRAS